MQARISRQVSISREEMEKFLRQKYLADVEFRFCSDAIEMLHHSVSYPIVIDVLDIIAILRNNLKEIPGSAKITELKINQHHVKASCVWWEEVNYG